MVDHGFLADTVHRENNLVLDAPRLNLHPPLLAIQHKRYGYDSLQCVALRTSIRGNICLPAGHTNREVQDALDGSYWYTWAIVLNRDALAVNFD